MAVPILAGLGSLVSRMGLQAASSAGFAARQAATSARRGVSLAARKTATSARKSVASRARSGSNFGDIMGKKTTQKEEEARVESTDAIEDETAARTRGMEGVRSLTLKMGFLTSGIAGLPMLMQKMTAGIVESSRGLAQFNGSMAATFGQLDAMRTQRSIRLAAATQRSTGFAAGGVNRLEEALLPMRAAMMDTINTLAGWAATGTAVVMEWANDYLPGWKTIVENQRAQMDESSGGVPWMQFLSGIAEGNFDNPVNPPAGGD